MAGYYKPIPFFTADGKQFATADGLDFYVNDNSDGYFADADNKQENLNTIAFGAYSFAGRKIKSLKLHHESGLLTDQLAIDTVSATVESVTKPTLSRYTPITVKRADKILGVFFDGQIKEAGYKSYTIYAESYITLLSDGYHFGGIYTGELAGAVIAEIMGGLPYTIHPDVAAVKIYGHLPYTKKRDNLLQILIATGAAITKNADGTIHFTALAGAVKGTFADNRVYIDGSLDEDTQVTAVQVTEHSYVPIEDEATLFTETFSDVKTITFSEPAHSLSITNGTILESGANYAKVQGAGNVVLTGKKYRHTAKIVTRGDLIGTPEDKIYTVTDATLVTVLNSSSVAQRLYNYAKCNRSVKANVLVNQERSGDMVQVVHPYRPDYLSAAIHSLDLNMSNVLRGSGEFLVGYEPQGISTGYTHRVVLTESGNHVVPAGVTECRAVLISGGPGGYGGYNGEPGQIGSYVFDDHYEGYTGGPGGQEGSGGQPGSGAKILDITIPVTPGQVIPATIGPGGIGGLNGAPGSEGTPTTFGDHTTADGTVWADGFVDIITAELFATAGTPGIDGAPGGDGSQTRYGEPGGNTETATGGPGGDYWEQGSDDSTGGGGGGGGAGYETDGGPGGNAHRTDGKTHGGDGGAGASPDAPDAALQFGVGGDGGHGGGGGGGAGGWQSPGYEATGTPGPGGIGSRGGTGGPGCIIIYY